MEEVKIGVDMDPSKTKVLTENYSKDAMTSSLSNVRFYQLNNQLREVAAFLVPPEPTPLPSHFGYVSEKPLAEFKPLYTIDVINTRNMTQRDARVQPYFLVELDPLYVSIINESKYAYVDPVTYGLEELFLAVAVTRNIIGKFPGPVDITVDNNVAAHMKLVDLTKLGERNFLQLSNRIVDVEERAIFLQYIRYRYCSTLVDETVLNNDSTDPEIKDSINNFTTYIVPYHAYEIELMNINRNIFIESHQHPKDYLQEYLSHYGPNATASIDTCRRVNKANCSVKVLKTTYGKMDVSHIYTIPSACLEAINTIKTMVNFSITMDNFTSVMADLRKRLRVDINRASAKQDYTSHVNVSKAVDIVAKSHWCLINPNLFNVTLMELDFDSLFENLYMTLSIITIQLIFPPTVFSPSIRLKINNAFAYSLVHHKIGSREYIVITEIVRAATTIVLPDFSMKTEWLDFERDILQLIYHYCSNLLIQQRYAAVRDIIKAYFNDVPSGVNGGTTKISQSRSETISLMTPYLRGQYGREYLRDKNMDQFREKRNMYPNGAILISRKNAPNESPEMHIITRRFNMILQLYIQSNNASRDGEPRPLFHEDEVRTIMEHISGNGLSRLSAIAKYYNYALFTYSSSVVCDSTINHVGIVNQEMTSITFSAALTLLILPKPDIILTDARPIPMYSGMRIMSELQLFLMLYNRVVGEIRGVPKNTFTKGQYVEITARLMEYLTGMQSYDPKHAFGYTPGDPQSWDEFLENKLLISNGHPLYKSFNEIITRMLSIVRQPDFRLAHVNKFYLVKAAAIMVSPDYSGPVLAASTLSHRQLKIVKVIHDISEYRTMTVNMNRQGHILDSEFAKLWRGMRTPAMQDLLQNRGMEVDAIEVRINARLDITVIKESGAFTGSGPKRGSSYTDFTEHINSAISQGGSNNVSHIPMFKIPITYLLNDIGSGNHAGTTWEHDVITDSVSRSLPLCQMIVPFESIQVGLWTPMDLIRTFTNPITVRNEPYEVVDDFQIDLSMK